MAYYRGDYYRGDYYRGDLGGFLKKAAKVVTGGVGGFLTGGPVGAIKGAVGGLVRQASNTSIVSNGAGTMGIGGTILRGAGKVVGPILAGKEVYDLGKGFGLFGGGANGKRRTMNHLNAKALVRATRRVEGFIKKARKAVSPLGYTVTRRASGGRCAPKRRVCK